MEITGKARYGEQHFGDKRGYYIQCDRSSQTYLCNDNVWREWSIQDIGIDNLFYMSEDQAKKLCKEHNIKYSYEEQDTDLNKEIKMEENTTTIIGKCVMVDTPEVSQMIQKLAFKVGIQWNGNGCHHFDIWPGRTPYAKFILFKENSSCHRFAHCLKTDICACGHDIVSLDEAVKLLKAHVKPPQPPHIEIKCDGIIHQVRFEKDSIKIGCTNISKRIVRQIAKAIDEFC